MPEVKDVHVDSALSNLSVQYKNEEYIWQEIMPVMKMTKRSDKFFKYQKDEQFRVPNDALGPKSLPNEVDLKLTTDNYSVKDHGLFDYVSKEEQDNADSPLVPETDAVILLTDLLHLAQEVRVAGVVYNAATYPTGNKVQLSGTGQWGGSADDPIGDIMTGLDAMFKRGNVISFGAESWTKFRQLPEILDAVKAPTRFQGTPGGMATRQQVAELFEVEKVVVGRARQNTAKEGQTGSYSRIWGKHCSIHYVEKNPRPRMLTFGATVAESMMKVFKVFDGKVGVKGATYIKNAWNSDEKIVASDVGYFIEDAVA